MKLKKYKKIPKPLKVEALVQNTPNTTHKLGTVCIPTLYT